MSSNFSAPALSGGTYYYGPTVPANGGDGEENNDAAATTTVVHDPLSKEVLTNSTSSGNSQVGKFLLGVFLVILTLNLIWWVFDLMVKDKKKNTQDGYDYWVRNWGSDNQQVKKKAV